MATTLKCIVKLHNNSSSCIHIYSRPVARNFNWVVLFSKIVDLLNQTLDFLTILWFSQTKYIVDNFGKFVAFSNKIVDLFGKIVDPLATGLYS